MKAQDHFGKSWRLAGYDYSQAGAYFVTVVSKHRTKLFGEIINYEMTLNSAGEMVKGVWLALPDKFAGLILDEYVVMPDHFHGILILNDDEMLGDKAGTSIGRTRVGTSPTATGTEIEPAIEESGLIEVRKRTEYSISDVIGVFKSITSVKYILGIADHNWQSFEGKLWQPSFHDRIIRNVMELQRIQAYINQNPARRDAHDLDYAKITKTQSKE